jgi:hypothetical protein
MIMIHRPISEDEEQEAFNGKLDLQTHFPVRTSLTSTESALDPFDPLETSPTDTNAIDSSLWELAALRNHYLASVSGLAQVFGEVMNKQNYTMEDFLDHSYATVSSSSYSSVFQH